MPKDTVRGFAAARIVPIYARGTPLSNGAMTKPFVRIASRGSPLALTQSRLVRSALAKAHGWTEAEARSALPDHRDPHDRRQNPGPAAVRGRRQGPLRQGDRRGPAPGRGRYRRAFHEGHAGACSRRAWPSPPCWSARTRTMCLWRATSGPSRGSSRTRSSARARSGVRRRRCGCARISKSSPCAAMSRRGSPSSRAAKRTASCWRAPGWRGWAFAPDGAEILEDWLPALCQGAIGIEIRESDQEATKLAAAIDHWNTHVAIACERGFLATLDGSCRTPIAGLARVEGHGLRFRGEVLTPDGRNVWTASRDIASATSSDAREAAGAAGRDAAREILERAGDKLPRF